MGSITLSQTTGWISPRTNPWAAASVSGDTAFQLVLSGVSTSLEAATVRVVSSTPMMTATASAIIAAKRNRKRIIELPHGSPQQMWRGRADGKGDPRPRCRQFAICYTVRAAGHWLDQRHRSDQCKSVACMGLGIGPRID